MASEDHDEPAQAPGSSRSQQYHVYVKLPFPRGAFVDPPLV